MRILTVYAHPDDESFGPAAVLARLVSEGAELHGLWFTRREHGQAVIDPPPPNLAELRTSALHEACSLIGYASVELLEYEDGTLDRLVEAAEIVRERLRRHSPDVVFTFGPAGITRHPDHTAVHRATLAALDGFGATLYYDAVPGPIAERF